MKTYTTKEWLEKTLPKCKEWRRFDNFLFAYPNGSDVDGVRFNINGEVDGPCFDAANARDGQTKPISRSTTIDLMCEAIEAGEVSEGASATDPYAHLPHGGWWVANTHWLFHFANDTGRSTVFDAATGDYDSSNVAWPETGYRDSSKLTRDQAIAIIEAHKASKEPTKAPLDQPEPEPGKEPEKKWMSLNDGFVSWDKVTPTIDPQLFELVKAILPARAAMDSYDGMKWAEGIASDTMQIAKAMLPELRKEGKK